MLCGYSLFESLLHENGIKASDVSKATKVPNSAFTDWKTGRSTPKFERMSKIADYFGIDAKHFYESKKRR